MATRTRIFVAFLGITLAAWMLASCGGSSNRTGRLQVLLADRPLDAEEINIFIKSVDVHKDGGGWYVLRVWETPLKVNLLEHTPEKPLLLADTPLSPGHYTQIRLILDSAEIVRNGEAYNVNLANVRETGVKCVGPFTVEQGQLCAIILDFNAGRSFVESPPGSNLFKLQPTLTMSPVNVAAKLFGKVVVKDASDVPQPIPEDAVLQVYQAGHIGDEASLIASADIDPLETDPLVGAFVIPILPQGKYDLRIVLNGTAVKDITDQAVVMPETDLGIITVMLP